MKQITELQAKNFKRSYSYKMGGTQTLVFPNGEEFYFNDKEFYSGRGAKYNSSIKHDNLGVITITKKEVSVFFKREKERNARIKKAEKERKEAAKRYEENKKNCVYGLKTYEYGTFVELSDEESRTRGFDAERLANTLNIDVKDTLLLNSEGKTYVFAETKDGKTIMLYHSDLSCNYLSISIDFDAEEKKKEFEKERDSWVNAPYADLVGQTSAKNHFVC
jgi:hypothetical protein